jgi:hypothetical protein
VSLEPWLGRSSPAITVGYYAHFMPEAGSKERTAVDGLLSGSGEHCMPVETPRTLPGFSPGPLTGDACFCDPSEVAVDCETEETGGLGRC